MNEDDQVLVPREVGEMFRVDRKTVTRWHKAGAFPNAFRTNGRHLRIPRSDVEALMQATREEPPTEAA